MDVEPRFARFARAGKVHVLRTELKFVSGAVPRTGDQAVDFTVALMGRQWALCGEAGWPGLLYGISHFDDADLCARCWQAWPHGTDLLFEHPQEMAAHQE